MLFYVQKDSPLDSLHYQMYNWSTTFQKLALLCPVDDKDQEIHLVWWA